jgi:23S rRNA pseudouridine2457 synthase
MLIAFNKPFGVLSQFTSDGSANRTLSAFDFPKNVYPIGRLDADSEGLLILSDEPEWNERLLHPRHAHEREYWAQVERCPTTETLKKLAHGVSVQGRKTLPCRAWILEPQPAVISGPVAASRQSAAIPVKGQPAALCRDTATPQIPPRDPPIRFRKSVPTCWIGLELVEGRNRQVRRMTAAIGHPTLRLIRVRIGGLEIGTLTAGEWRVLSIEERRLLAGSGNQLNNLFSKKRLGRANFQRGKPVRGGIFVEIRTKKVQSSVQERHLPNIPPRPG